ncbi:MAG: hypothetical protein LBD49_00285, partial [Oscillospiraceae bacterium]|nr:hypothetical protein [Oscillospiraceae bacterium]
MPATALDTGGVPLNLTVLGLSGNPLGGAIPEGLASLTKLRVLTAYGCGFEGKIPDALGSLTNLQILD